MSYKQHLSLVVSDVFSDIGVNKKMVNKWRQECLLREALHQIPVTLRAKDISIYDCQIEESLVYGLFSDENCLFSSRVFNSVQNWEEWQQGERNILIIQDETTSPGYCKLQALNRDVPLPVTNILSNYNVMDQRGRILFKNRMMHSILYFTNVERQGPSIQTSQLQDSTDNSMALFCNSWPFGAQPWLQRQSKGSWPSRELRKSTAKTGCFFVESPNHHNEAEWKMSFLLAHRSLMSSLNITQIRCFFLMRMIVKTFITPHIYSSISDEIIKTVLFHCIEITNDEPWQENNLLKCLELCLMVLRYFISNSNCPDFFIHDNNLISGKLEEYEKPHLLEVFSDILASNGRKLLEIDFACFGSRLSLKLNGFSSLPNACIKTKISGIFLAIDIASSYSRVLKTVQHDSSLTVAHHIKKSLFHLVSIYKQGNTLEKQACTFIVPLFCSSLGSVIASVDINTKNSISGCAYTWLSAGLNSDVSSGRLKLASALYCAGDIEKSEYLLRETANRYIENNSDPVCNCTIIRLNPKNTDHKKENIAYCVQFLRCEENCIPKELRYEMFRSSQEDMCFRSIVDYWMDWAVVDSFPYLCFLQYKIYKHLGKVVEQQQALLNLFGIIHTEQNLGHRETALNLLGQCMEKENRFDGALSCYMRSLQVRARNNAAKTHICRLLAIIQIQRIYDVNSLNADRSTVASCGREEQRHNLSNSTATSSEGGQPDAQNACGHQSSNLFKKDFENTLAEKLVDDMSVKMKSVGAIVYEGVRGTVFRVGSKYIMTALHIVTGITNPRKRQDIPENDWSKLEEPTVWVTFAASAMDLESPPFYLKRDVIFMDKRLDVAVLEIKPGNILPRKLQLSKDMGQTEHVNLIGFGHPTDPRKQLDPKCELVTVTNQLCLGIQTESNNFLQLHGLDLNLLTGSYNELSDTRRFVCHATMEHGASGAPAIAENEVVGLLVKGLPTFYYELRSKRSTAQYVQDFPNHLKFELCSKTDYIYRILRHTNPMLAENLFD